MPGLNETGLPSTADYNLGRGIIYFAPLDVTTEFPMEYRDLGNAPEFSISVETETLEHQSSRAGLKVTDKEVLISQKISLSLTLDEINFDNLAILLSGTAVASSLTNPAVAGFSIKKDWIVVSDLVLGRWYDLTDGASNLSGTRIYDIQAAGDVDLFNGSDEVELVNGTAVGDDYQLDLEMGRVFFNAGASKIAAGVQVDFTLAAGAAKSVDEVRALEQTTVTGALKFIAENPASSDKQTEFQFHKVSLKAEGDFSLIGDEFTQMQFTAVAERSILADPDSPTLTVRTVRAT